MEGEGKDRISPVPVKIPLFFRQLGSTKEVCRRKEEPAPGLVVPGYSSFTSQAGRAQQQEHWGQEK